MFKFNEVWASNAIVFPEVKYTFPKGVVLVTGENQDEKSKDASNGAGKSALFELIPTVLFDRPARGNLGKDALFLDPEQPVEIGLSFSYRGNTYRVVMQRTKNRGTFRIYQNDEEITPRGGIPAARKAFKELLPINEETYYNLVHVSPNKLSQLIEGTPQSRYTYLSQLFGLDKLDILREELQKQISEIQENIPDVPGLTRQLIRAKAKVHKLRSYEGFDETFVRVRNRYKQASEVLLRKRDKLEQLLDENLEFVIEALKEQPLESWKKEKGRLRWAIKRLEKRVQRLQDILAKYIAYASEFEKLIRMRDEVDFEKYHDPEKLKKRLLRVKRWHKYASILYAAENIREVVLNEVGLDLAQMRTSDFADLDTQADLLNHQRGRYAERVEMLEEELEQVNSLLDQEANDTSQAKEIRCPTCGTVLNREKLLKRKEQLIAKIKDAEEKLAKVKQEARKVSRLRRFSAYFYKYHSMVEQVPEVIKEKLLARGIEEAFSSLSKELEVLEKAYPLVAKAEKLRKATQRLPRLREIVSRQEDYLYLLRKRLLKAEQVLDRYETLKSLGWDGSSRKHLMVQLNILNERLLFVDKRIYRLAGAQGALYVYLEELATLEEETKQLEEKLAEGRKRIKRLRVYKDLVKLLGPKGLKKRVVNYYLDSLLFYVRRFAAKLFRNIHIDFLAKDNSLHIICRIGDKQGDIRTMSSGQRKRLTLAFVAALAMVLPSSKTNILILDEIDANVDRLGLERIDEFMPVLKKVFDTVFLLTPQRDAFSRYDHHWHLVRNNGRSKLIKLS